MYHSANSSPNQAVALNPTMDYTVLRAAAHNGDAGQRNYYLVATDRKDALLEKLPLLHNAEEVITLSGVGVLYMSYV